MGAARVMDVDHTSETVASRPVSVRAERAQRVEARTPFDLSDLDLDLDQTIDTTPDSDFADDDFTDPDPLSPFAPAWAPADIGQSLIDEWDASAPARAARPARVAAILRATAENTAITAAEKLAVRSAS